MTENNKYLKDRFGEPIHLSKEQEYELIKKYQTQKDNASLEQLILSQLRFVYKIAVSYITDRCELDDLIQEGILGVIRAVEKFDLEKNMRLTTYSNFWIRQYLGRYSEKNNPYFYTPAYLVNLMPKYKRYLDDYYKEFKKMPTDKEVAEQLSINIELAGNLPFYISDVISIEEPIDEDFYIKDILKDPNDVEEKICMNFLLYDENKLMEKYLTNSEQAVLKYRFGFMNGNTMTLNETANILSKSIERVRKIEQSAIKKLRQPYLKAKLKDYAI